MLSREEAVDYVTNILKIPSSLVQRRKESSFEFLTGILRSTQVHLPFQTASLMATEPSSRRRPSPEEIKESCLAGKGGLCYETVVFMKCLLDALGYDTHYVHVKVGSNSIHIAIIIKNVVAPGDRFIFDAASGYPTFELIPLDFEVETETFNHSFLTYKYTREGSLVVRCHRHRPKIVDPLDPPGFLDNGWKKVMHIDLTPRELDYFASLFDAIYKDLDGTITPFHSSLRIVAFDQNTLKPVIVKDASLLTEGDSTTSLKERKLNSLKELMEIVDDHYPSLRDDVILALRHLDLFSKEQ